MSDDVKTRPSAFSQLSAVLDETPKQPEPPEEVVEPKQAINASELPPEEETPPSGPVDQDAEPDHGTLDDDSDLFGWTA